MGETTISRLVDKVNELSDNGKELRVQLAAKDREIAELRQQRNEELVLQLRFIAERDEARECVKRLSSALSGLFGADLQTCMVERDGHDDQIEAVEAARAALAATPEHLRP